MSQESLQDKIRWFEKNVSDAKTLRSEELWSEVANVTPQFARWLLDGCNINNRPIKKAAVQRFTEIIAAGRWKLTSQGISVSRVGKLNNGQHRLSGIANGLVSVPVYMTFGEDCSAFEVLDTNIARGGADTLHVYGFQNVASLAAAARLVKYIEAGQPTSSHPIANDELHRFVLAHPGLSDATTIGGRLAHKFKGSAAACVAAAYLIASRSVRADRLQVFIDRTIEGANLVPKDPVLVLRDGFQSRTLDAHVRGGGLRAPAVCASVIKAWNLWSRSRKATPASIRWEPSEPFPVVE